MGVRILTGHEQGDRTIEQSVLFDSVTGKAFGPVFDEREDGTSSEENAQGFLDYVAARDTRSPHRIPDYQLDNLYSGYVHAVAHEAEATA